MTARLFNVVVGTWLVVSAFTWPHDVRMFKATIGFGLLTIVLSVASMFAGRGTRYVTLGLAFVLFMFSAIRVGRHDPVFWNNAIVASVIFLTALTAPRLAGTGALDPGSA